MFKKMQFWEIRKNGCFREGCCKIVKYKFIRKYHSEIRKMVV